MPTLPETPAPFQLIADHVVLDFVNTQDVRVGPGDELDGLPRYRDLLRFSEESGLISREETDLLVRKASDYKGDLALLEGLALRGSLAQVFKKIIEARVLAARGEEEAAEPHEVFVNLVAGKAKEAYSARVLDWTGELSARRLEWTVDRVQAQLPVSRLALAAVDLLTSRDVDQVRTCADPTCGWLFMDRSKNHRRRWCDMTVCGNRMKARRFKARE
ncbi:MAG TPA: CGNR zinc finger domain-containing protein [Acidisarcina sp.]